MARLIGRLDAVAVALAKRDAATVTALIAAMERVLTEDEIEFIGTLADAQPDDVSPADREREADILARLQAAMPS